MQRSWFLLVLHKAGPGEPSVEEICEPLIIIAHQIHTLSAPPAPPSNSGVSDIYFHAKGSLLTLSWCDPAWCICCRQGGRFHIKQWIKTCQTSLHVTWCRPLGRHIFNLTGVIRPFDPAGLSQIILRILQVSSVPLQEELEPSCMGTPTQGPSLPAE